MRREIISDALGNINSLYIKEATEYVSEEKRVWNLNRNALIRWASIAACFFLIITAVFVSLHTGLYPDGGLDGNHQGGDMPQDPDGSNSSVDNGDNNRFSIGNGSLRLEIYDAYTIPSEADVITVYLTDFSRLDKVYFRSSSKILSQDILRIETTDGVQSATCDNGVFTFDIPKGCEYVALNLYFDAGTFKNSTEIIDGTEGRENADYDASSPKDEDIYDDCISPAEAVVYFECSVVAPDGGYDEIRFTRALSAILDEPKVSLYGTTDSIEEAINLVGLQAILLFEEYTPMGISYRKTNEFGHVRYQYGINATVTVQIYEYYSNDYTLDTFVYSTDIFDYELYAWATETKREKDGLPYSIYSCYKNSDEWKSEIAVLNYNENGSNIFFVVRFDLFGEDTIYEVKPIIEQMTLIH
ncbi:MAG: hypothetical protein IJF38_00860 [Clostridia bacterium]|nr:hypothetical protein [Clostridia bacterium]